MRAAAILPILLVACGGLPDPVWSAESPPESGAWTTLPAPPPWVECGPALGDAPDGTIRFVVDARSNMRNIAAVKGGSARQIEMHLQRSLAPAVGEVDAARAASAGAAAAKLVERAAKDEWLTRNPVPGNTLSTVWTLCEVPESAVLDAVPADLRDAARAALVRRAAAPK
ncbi:MAG: hypothetical protein HMLKMBBP_00036 [Planctomycetes bacterium]|nr:hypothetical protein [Planctomycetota bacterium]